MHYLIGGEGPPVVIVHGAFDSWWSWRTIASELARDHTVILPAIRGLGKSSKPASGYDADNLGDDLHRLLAEELNIERFDLVGHDWGAMVSYALTAQYPESVRKLAILDMVIPGVGLMEEAMQPKPAGQFLWHMSFQSIPDLPEMLIRNNLREYMQLLFTNYAANPHAVNKESLDRQVALYSEVGALRALLAYYQNYWVHAEQIKARMAQKLQMPVLAYGGDASLGTLTQACMEELAEDVRGGVIPNCGHWVGEENPEFVSGILRDFFSA
ncbi:alpha/beta fold hydrolase [Streptomyces brasiliscabiei]|uniref:alpha/beta fold hydrolase n=1 Tax=Streptomyces brasiliscabiei TaxID=2736302 RepID=UPI001C10A73A|nr:alpha/beta hydrolase [Streptomyces brasiliscabiei]